MPFKNASKLFEYKTSKQESKILRGMPSAIEETNMEKSKNFANINLTTTPQPIRSGRNSAYFPALILLPDNPMEINQVLPRYPDGAYLKQISDRHQVRSNLYDILSKDDRKLARYRKHPQHGWLEELSTTWTVNGDHPTILASGTIANSEDQGSLNITTAMRFGTQLIALLMGNSDPAIRNEVLHVLAKIVLRTGDNGPDVEIVGEAIRLTL